MFKYKVLKECINDCGNARFVPGERINLGDDEAARLIKEGCVEEIETRTVKAPENRKRGRPRKK